MSDKNMPKPPPPPVQYDYAVAAPPFLVRREKGKKAPEILVQKTAAGETIKRNPHTIGDEIVSAMAFRIERDQALILEIGRLMLGGDSTTFYKAEDILNAVKQTKALLEELTAKMKPPTIEA